MGRMYSRRAAALAVCSAAALTVWATGSLGQQGADESDRRLRAREGSSAGGVSEVLGDQWQLDAPRVACRHVDSEVFRDENSRVGLVSMKDRGDGGCTLLLFSKEESDIRDVLRLGASDLLNSEGAALVRMSFTQTTAATEEAHVKRVEPRKEPAVRPLALAEQSDGEGEGETLTGFGGTLIALVVTGLLLAICKEYYDSAKERKAQKAANPKPEHDDDDGYADGVDRESFRSRGSGYSGATVGSRNSWIR